MKTTHRRTLFAVTYLQQQIANHFPVVKVAQFLSKKDAAAFQAEKGGIINRHSYFEKHEASVVWID